MFKWSFSTVNCMQLYDDEGQRKYLTPGERDAFLKAAEDAPREVRTFCGTLVYTGCRITEALELTADRVDLKGGVLVLESLKKRKRGVYRAVPVPPVFLDTLNLVHNLRAIKKRKGRGKGVVMWEWCRTTAWSRVCEVMATAGISGRHATPKGLRHAFGIKGVSSQVPLNMVQKWLGHADLATTAIYADAVGAEAKEIAERMWG
jgi:integrase